MSVVLTKQHKVRRKQDKLYNLIIDPLTISFCVKWDDTSNFINIFNIWSVVPFVHFVRYFVDIEIRDAVVEYLSLSKKRLNGTLGSLFFKSM